MKTPELLKKLKSGKCELIRNGSRHDIWYQSDNRETICSAKTQGRNSTRHSQQNTERCGAEIAPTLPSYIFF